MIRLNRSALAPSPALSGAAAHLGSLPDPAAADYASASAAPQAWRSMRVDLVDAQQDKCGWCESTLVERAIEVDHIRPKSRQQYWWLAFDLENLLAACRSCNNFKHNRWPLPAGAQPLRPRQVPHQVRENALMIDPTVEDPGLHLTFQFISGTWHIAASSERGRETITVLELDRITLTKSINYHARHVLDPLVRILHKADAAGDQGGFMAAGRNLATYGTSDHPCSAFSQKVLREALAGSYRP